MSAELNQILISYKEPDFDKKLEELRVSTFQATWFRDDSNRDKVKDIVEDVSKRGDKAVAEYTEKFDGIRLKPEEFRISDVDLKKAHKEIEENNPELLQSIHQAIENVRKYQKEIYIGNFEHHGIKYTPIERVGICVPGAAAPLPSTVIMTAIPAQVAGVKHILVVSPPRYKGSIHPAILAVCYEVGVDEVYRIGGAQAVAALAFGDKKSGRIKVDKIVGPGNQWVQMAKREVFGVVDIDSIAGPSEVLVIANDKSNPVWVATDMLSQAEHSPGSAVLFTDSEKLALEVLAELKRQAGELSRSKEAIDCLLEFGAIVIFGNMADVVDYANVFAAEHLEVQCGEQSRQIADKINNAGAIFIGDYSPVAVGDYWAGPSHTLPTGGSAKFSSALSANDFIKSTSIIEYDKKKLADSAEDIIRLAKAEGLDAHARSVQIRQEK